MTPEDLCSQVTPGDFTQYCQPLSFGKQWEIFVRYIQVSGFPWLSILFVAALGGIVLWSVQRKVSSPRRRFILSLMVAVAVVIVPLALTYLGFSICLPLCRRAETFQGQ